jgi:hypothetical protein
VKGVFSLQTSPQHKTNFFNIHPDASKSAKTPFFERKIEIEKVDERKSFLGEGRRVKPIVTSYFRGV